MVKFDYIIVGLGLAGLTFIEQLEKHNKSYMVFENTSQTSSKVAGGVYNPIILKRFTPVWNGHEQIQTALPFYKSLEEKLNQKFLYPLETICLFNSVSAQNNWFVAADKPVLSTYIDPKIHHEKITNIEIPHGFGLVKNTGWIHTQILLEAYSTYLKNKKNIIFEDFEYSNIQLNANSIGYKNYKASKIVFCEGYGIHKNPFFNHLPLNEAKGELLTIHAPDLNLNYLLKGPVFILPIGNHYYKIGATFNWTDKTNTPTKEGKEALEKKLKTIIKCPYKITNHTAGIRPTVKDRRPLIGVHHKHLQLAVFNGLGTRGVMLAPTLAMALYNHLEHNKPLSTEIDIKRF